MPTKKNICKLKNCKKSWDFRENFWKDPNKKPQKPRWSYFPPQRRKKWPSYLLEIQDGFPMSRCFSRTRRSTPCGHRKPRPASKTRGPASWEKCLNISETNPYLDPVFLGKPQKENRAESNNEQGYIFTWLNLMMWWCVCLRNTPTESWDLKTSYFVLKILKQNDLRHSIPSVYLQVSNEIPWLFWYGQYYLFIFGITCLYLGIIMLNNYQHPGSLLNHQNT